MLKLENFLLFDICNNFEEEDKIFCDRNLNNLEKYEGEIFRKCIESELKKDWFDKVKFIFENTDDEKCICKKFNDEYNERKNYTKYNCGYITNFVRIHFIPCKYCVMNKYMERNPCFIYEFFGGRLCRKLEFMENKINIYFKHLFYFSNNNFFHIQELISKKNIYKKKVLCIIINKTLNEHNIKFNKIITSNLNLHTLKQLCYNCLNFTDTKNRLAIKSLKQNVCELIGYYIYKKKYKTVNGIKKEYEYISQKKKLNVDVNINDKEILLLNNKFRRKKKIQFINEKIDYLNEAQLDILFKFLDSEII